MARIPAVKIDYLNGQLGSMPDNRDGYFLMAMPGAAIGNTFALDKGYEIRSTNGLESLGLTLENNRQLVQAVSQFYDQAGTGTPVVIAAYDNSKKMSEYVDKDTGTLKAVIDSYGGNLRGVFVGSMIPDAPVTDSGVEADVTAAIPKANLLAEFFTTERYAPLFLVLDGICYDPAKQLKAINSGTNNRVAVLVGSASSSSRNADLGLLAGRLVAIPVQRNIGRVRDGALVNVEEMFIGGKPVEGSADQVSDLNDKGYLTFRTHIGKTGYYFVDDWMACDTTDDYAHIALRRVIDKAYRIAYVSLLNYLNDEVYLNPDGTMQEQIARSWEAAVETDIDSQMTVQGELSGDDGGQGSGCQCTIDTSNNVASTSEIKGTLKVRPFGYSRWISIQLGFLVENT